MIRDDLAPRIYFDEPVALAVDGDGTTVEGRAHNLSLTGIFVGGVEPFAAETQVRLSFDLPDGALFSAEATVLRVVDEPGSVIEPSGMALRFDTVDEISAERLRAFIEGRLQPAAGERVKLSLDGVDMPIATRAQSSFGNIMSVDAELPFLRVGSNVALTGEAGQGVGTGAIRWVSVHVCPQSGVPRLNIGVELGDHQIVVDEEFDPVCTDDFAVHAEVLDKQIRAERRNGASSDAAAG